MKKNHLVVAAAYHRGGVDFAAVAEQALKESREEYEQRALRHESSPQDDALVLMTVDQTVNNIKIILNSWNEKHKPPLRKKENIVKRKLSDILTPLTRDASEDPRDMSGLKLYVWPDFEKVGYMKGQAFAVASDRQEAVAMIEAQYGAAIKHWGECDTHELDTKAAYAMSSSE